MRLSLLLCLLAQRAFAGISPPQPMDEAATSAANASTLRVVCYYRWLHRGIEPSQLHLLKRQLTSNARKTSEGTACSHIILGFATIGDDFRANLTDVGGVEGVSRFVSEGRPSQSTRMMLSFGGGGGGSRKNFRKLVANRTAVNTFQESLKLLIITTGLDGVDFDWEFPGILQAGQFGRFLEQTKLTLNAIKDGPKPAQQSDVKGSAARLHKIATDSQAVTIPNSEIAQETGVSPFQEKQEDLELSVAVPGPFTLTAGYSPDHLRDNCTFINVMTYDLVLYERWHPLASLHSALYGQGGLFGLLKPFSVEYSMANWADLGIPKHMLLLGIPTYGVAYELVDATHNYHLAATKGYSRLGVNIDFDTACRVRAENPNRVKFHQTARVPFVHDGKANWITYDDERSVAEKAAFAAEQGYGGIMVFSLNADDPRGECAKLISDQANTAEENLSVVSLSELLSEPFPLTRIAAHTLKEASVGRSQDRQPMP